MIFCIGWLSASSERYNSGTTTGQHSVQRAPDKWDSARLQALCVAWSWFRESGVVSSRLVVELCRDTPAGNANR
jgi:hypothetical protein